jgi:hypothetical protein
MLWVVVITALGAGFLFLMFGTDFGKDPSKKTLPQLRRAAELHAKRMRGLNFMHPKFEVWRAEMQRVDDEIEKREAILALQLAEATSAPSHPTGPALRAAAQEAYEVGRRKAKAVENDDQKVHGMALTAVLFERLRQDAPLIQLNKSTIDVLTMEILPFKLLPPAQGAAALCEYVVWRERPIDADTEIVTAAIRDASEIMRSKPDGAAFVESLRNLPFPWAGLLPASA